MSDKKNKSSIEETLKSEVLKARFQFQSPKFQSPSQSKVIEMFLLLPEFQEKLKIVMECAKTKNLEAGFSCSYPIKNISPGSAGLDIQCGKVVIGNEDEIKLSDDPAGEYFAHAQRRLPLLMLHGHPSGNLGLSRADCLTAQTIVREVMGILPTSTSIFFSPIFAVATAKSASNEVDLLAVQRKRSGEFMGFEQAGFGFGLHAWLAAPEFNVAHAKISFTDPNQVQIDVYRDDLVNPFRA